MISDKQIDKFNKLCKALDEHILKIQKTTPEAWLFCNESGFSLMSDGKDEDICEEFCVESYIPVCSYDSGAW